MAHDDRLTTEAENRQLAESCCGATLTMCGVFARIVGWPDVAEEAERLRGKVFDRIDAAKGDGPKKQF